MALTVTSKVKNVSSGDGSVNALGERSYEVVFEVDQDDAGPLADGVAVTLAAIALGGSGRVYGLGEEYSLFTTDLDSYCQLISWKRPDPANNLKRWHVTCNFGPSQGTDPGVYTEDNPLLWPVIYDVDFIEEQVPLDKARVVESLSHIGRAAGSLGPVINAAGVEFTEAALTTIWYPILIAKKNYSTLDEIVALNLAYQGTTNSDTYFGAATRKAKFLSTASGGRQQVNGTVYYPGTTRIWFKDATWDRGILNNGWSHLVKSGGNYKLDSAGKPKLFKNKVHDDPNAAAETDPDQDCSEPLNMALDGTLQPSDVAGLYLNYRDLNEVSYAGIGIGS
jgi:hypothetical protein